MVQITKSMPEDCHFTGRKAQYAVESNPRRPPGKAVPAHADLALALDLRRRQPQPVVEAILALARHAPIRERGIIAAIYEDGRTLTDIALASGENPRTVQRRYRRAVARLIEPRYAFVAEAHTTWPDRRRLVANLHFLSGHTIRDIARRLALTEHAVRREIAVVDALFEEFTRTQSAPAR